MSRSELAAVEGHSAPNERIALYCHRLGSSGGGAQRMVCMLAEALVARNFVVHLISWDDHRANSFYALSSAVKWHRLGFGVGKSDKLRRVRALAKILRQQRIAVLIGFVMSGDRSIYAAAKLAGTKLIAAERNAPTFYWTRYRRVERWLAFIFLHLANRIAVQFPQFVSGYPSTLRHRIDVIPNPVPIVTRKAKPGSPNQDGRFILLAVSRLDRVQKGLHRLIEAFALVADRHASWDLQIIGDGPEYPTLAKQAALLGMDVRIRLQKSAQDVFQAYSNSQLFVIPSRWEGFPNALAEAMAHGLPAVGFCGAPGVNNLIDDGKTGWLADGVDDPITLANALHEAMSDGNERARRGENSAKAMSAYDPEVQFELWADLIRSIR